MGKSKMNRSKVDNNNLNETASTTVPQNEKERSGSFEMSVWMACVMLLLAIVMAVIPGFFILGYAQGLLLDTPTSGSVFVWAIYVVKAPAVIFGTVMATLIYADMVFPAVMEAFVFIMNRTALPDSVHHQQSVDVSGTGNISGISGKSVVIE
uniref:Uncharacterized protein n=1 Tax=Plectus sambesii TaxID=2011161 RepID=A0A914UK29_9BILA